MMYFTLSAILIIGVLQVCTASPTSSDATKIFTDDELRLAKDAGISETTLFDAILTGFTVEEILKFNQLDIINGPKSKKNVTFEFMTKVCEILEAEHKTATSFTSEQETRLVDLVALIEISADQDLAIFVRMTLCDYISQPESFEKEAASFGSQVVTYMGLRYLKMKAQKVSGGKRVGVANEMCCYYENVDKVTNLRLPTLSDLSDVELNGFDQHWIDFEAANSSKSFEDMCNFLHVKHPNFECEIIVPVDGV